jgi:hypothetical protein
MSNFRSSIDKCSKYNVELCEPQKKIVFKFMENYKNKNKRVISMKQAVRNIVSEYGKIMNIKTEENEL